MVRLGDNDNIQIVFALQKLAKCAYTYECPTCCCNFERTSASSPLSNYSYGAVSFFGYRVNRAYPTPYTSLSWNSKYGQLLGPNATYTIYPGFDPETCPTPDYPDCAGTFGDTNISFSGEQALNGTNPVITDPSELFLYDWDGDTCSNTNIENVPVVIVQKKTTGHAVTCPCADPEPPPNNDCSQLQTSITTTNCSDNTTGIKCLGTCTFSCIGDGWVVSENNCINSGNCVIQYRHYTFANSASYNANYATVVKPAGTDDPNNPWTEFHPPRHMTSIGQLGLPSSWFSNIGVTIFYGPAIRSEIGVNPLSHGISVTLSGGPSFANGSYGFSQADYSNGGWGKVISNTITRTYIQDTTAPFQTWCGSSGTYCDYYNYYTHRNYEAVSDLLYLNYGQGSFSLSYGFGANGYATQTHTNPYANGFPADPISYPNPYTYTYYQSIPNGACGYFPTPYATFRPNLADMSISSVDTVTYNGVWEIGYEDETYNEFQGCGECWASLNIPQTVKYRAGSITVSVSGGDYTGLITDAECEATSGTWNETQTCDVGQTCPAATESPTQKFGDTQLKECQGNVEGCDPPCDVDSTCCFGVCVNLNTDFMNCGSCNNECAANDLCCGGACTDINTDFYNCGVCGYECPAGKTCVDGTCRTICAGQQCAYTWVDNSCEPDTALSCGITQYKYRQGDPNARGNWDVIRNCEDISCTGQCPNNTCSEDTNADFATICGGNEPDPATGEITCSIDCLCTNSGQLIGQWVLSSPCPTGCACGSHPSSNGAINGQVVFVNCGYPTPTPTPTPVPPSPPTPVPPPPSPTPVPPPVPPPPSPTPSPTPPCDPPCAEGQTCCNGNCVNTQTDNSNCGSCGHACTATQTCINGVCEDQYMCVDEKYMCVEDNSYMCVELINDKQCVTWSVNVQLVNTNTREVVASNGVTGPTLPKCCTSGLHNVSTNPDGSKDIYIITVNNANSENCNQCETSGKIGSVAAPPAGFTWVFRVVVTGVDCSS